MNGGSLYFRSGELKQKNGLFPVSVITRALYIEVNFK